MTRYYAWLNDAVAGPFAPEELRGLNLTRESQVCVEGSDAWVSASALPDLALLFAPAPARMPPSLVTSAPASSSAPRHDTPPADLPPKLRELWLICRHAPDELLLEQKKKYWKKYFKNEHEIIEAEIARRPAMSGTALANSR